MTAVAIVAVAVIALGVCAAICGIAVSIISCATLLLSALYRHKPEIFDNVAKTIKSTVRSSFFKPQLTGRDHADNLDFVATNSLVPVG